MAPAGAACLGTRYAGATGQSRRDFTKGLVLCIFSGLLSACANLGFEFAEPIGSALIAHGSHPVFATIGRWLPLYWGGAIVVFSYCALVMTRNRAWTRFGGSGAGRDLVLTLIVVALLCLGQLPYGMGTYYLGKLGTSVGWALSISTSLIVATGVGLLAGEWKSAGRRAIVLLALGVATLALAMSLLAFGNSLNSAGKTGSEEALANCDAYRRLAHQPYRRAMGYAVLDAAPRAGGTVIF